MTDTEWRAEPVVPQPDGRWVREYEIGACAHVMQRGGCFGGGVFALTNRTRLPFERIEIRMCESLIEAQNLCDQIVGALSPP